MVQIDLSPPILAVYYTSREFHKENTGWSRSSRPRGKRLSCHLAPESAKFLRGVSNNVQTKVTIFVLTITIYLLGLALFANQRAQTNSRLQALAGNSVSVGQEVSNLVSAMEGALDRQAAASTPAPRRVLTQPPAVVVDNPAIVSTIRAYNRNMSKRNAQRLAQMIEKTAKRHQVDPLLVTALVSQESAFHSKAVSPVGAIGLGQLMPYTAADLGVDPYDPEENLDGCVRYLAQNLRAWSHTSDPVSLALASYNAGPGAVQAYAGIPPYQETIDYVAIITSRYDNLKTLSLAQDGRRPFG